MPGLVETMTSNNSQTIDNDSQFNQFYLSELSRFKSFASLPIFPSLTRHQLAIAGFHYRNEKICCPSCGVSINIEDLDVNKEYESNYFRKLHRKKVSQVGIRCSFLLEETGQNINDLSPSLTNDRPPEEPEYANYEKRLETFSSWPHRNKDETETSKTSYVTPEIMAKFGFFYSGPNDGVTCFTCGNILTDWTEAIKSKNEKIVQLEHARFFPNCPFIVHLAGPKYTASAGFFHVVSMKERTQRNPMSQPVTPILCPLAVRPLQEISIPKSVEECILTYNDWPSNAPVQAKALAQAGFYYVGKDLEVHCYKCGLTVGDWRSGMTAIGTHRRRMPYDCEFIRAIDSTRVGNIQSVNEKWRLETLAGYSFDFVRSSSSSRPTTTNFDEQENRQTRDSEADKLLCRELAACGFYRIKNKKIIRCAFCGVTIEPKPNQSIMSQHRANVKQIVLPSEQHDHLQVQSQYHSSVDCIMVRCQCAANIPIEHRAMFPEYPKYRSIFDRLKTFQEKKLETLYGFSIREIADAGFFLDAEKHLRCFQCGNSLPINAKKKREKYSEYNIQQLHAHFYPTCEYIKELLGSKYIAQVLHDLYRS
ncbi:unnamed protein product, partial [Didymodactylos carnosus]